MIEFITNTIFLMLLRGFVMSNAAETVKLNFGKNLDASVLQTGKALSNSLITRLTGASFLSCLTECAKRPRCHSINYRRQFLLCDLNQEAINNNAVENTQGSLFTLISPWISSLDNECSKNSSIGEELKVECLSNEFGSIEKYFSDCGIPPGIPKATYNAGNGIGLFSKATYSCDSGYAGNERPTISCMNNGTWSYHGFQCIKGKPSRDPCNPLPQVCGPGFEPDGTSCDACEAGTFSASTDINACSECPSDQYNYQSQQDSCLNCTINDSPCGTPYTLQYTNVVVQPRIDRKECRATYFCRNILGASIESQNVFVICDRDSGTFHWTRPSLHCVPGFSNILLVVFDSQYDDCGNLVLSQTSYSGQIFQINGLSGGNLYCDNSYDGDYWTVVQQRSSAAGNDPFDRSWSDFKSGFGSINNDYWIGNDNLHRLTDGRNYEVVILLWIKDGNYTHQETARYRTFKVKSESDNYQLQIGNFDSGSGDADNVIGDRNGWPFSAKDKELSGQPCSEEQNSGWWHKTYASGQICTTSGNVNALKWRTFYEKTRVLIKPT